MKGHGPSNFMLRLLINHVSIITVIVSSNRYDPAIYNAGPCLSHEGDWRCGSTPFPRH